MMQFIRKCVFRQIYTGERPDISWRNHCKWFMRFKSKLTMKGCSSHSLWSNLWLIKMVAFRQPISIKTKQIYYSVSKLNASFTEQNHKICVSYVSGMCQWPKEGGFEMEGIPYNIPSVHLVNIKNQHILTAMFLAAVFWKDSLSWNVSTQKDGGRSTGLSHQSLFILVL